MRALSLFGVLIIARVLSLAGQHLDLSIWTPFAYVWQDVLVALAFAAFDRAVGNRAAWTLYGVLVIYIAINVPITRILSSPLTWTMMRAAGAPLSDSIALYLTSRNVGLILVVCLAGVAFPLICHRLRFRLNAPIVISSLIVALFGIFSVSRIDTIGFHRNAIGALWPRRLVVWREITKHIDLRISPFTTDEVEDLSALAGSASGRNVVLIILESAAARYLKPYGSSEDPMPNLTKLANESILFENAYAVYPESIKGLFSTLCSGYPPFNSDAEKYDTIPCTSLAQRFSHAGYRTALFHSGRFMYLGMESVIERRGFDTLEDAGAIGGNVNSSFGVDEHSAVRRILSWVDSLPHNQRFFLAYLPVAGHHPYVSPVAGPYSEETEFGRYRNALHYGDAALGELMDGMRSRNLDSKTLYVIFGDHGEGFGQHRGNFGHTLFIHDENVRVPYLIAAPGIIKQQMRISRVASLIDTAPTILDLAGLPIPTGFQGNSLLTPLPRMALFFTDYSLGWLGLRDACWKYTFETGSSWSRLYDVCADPDETRDLSKSNQQRVDRYRQIVSQWMGAAL